MTKRVHWTCPGCGKVYAVPSTAGLTVCPKCQQKLADSTGSIPIVSPSRNRIMIRVVAYSMLAVWLLWFVIAITAMTPDAGLGSIGVVGAVVRSGLVALLGTFVTMGCLAVYFVPSYIAHVRKHPNATPILIVNIFAGWTLIGWVAALVWCFTVIPEP